jgi:UDP-N-acetylmuramoyl-tripeptide--D-alanyl-D-alanine ligase
MRAEGERCAVLGDMLELGKASREEHERIGQAVVDAGIPMLLTLGRASRALYRAARARAEERGQRLVAQHCTDVDQLAAALDALLALGDVVLVKGSRGMRMERIVDELRLRRGSMEARV